MTFLKYSGSKNSPVLPHGLFYEGVTEINEHVNTDIPPPKGMTGTWRKYAGASAGQSPLIHALDIGLSIEHKSISGTKLNPMLEMREYLSQSIRQFLENLSQGPQLRDFIYSHKDNQEWTDLFNGALEAYKTFRDAHIQLTTVYIIQQTLKDKAQGHHSSSEVIDSHSKESYIPGTGGTDLVKFLKQTRDETKEAKIGGEGA
jgi:indoleamine 2,3-dioxygenase